MSFPLDHTWQLACLLIAPFLGVQGVFGSQFKSRYVMMRILHVCLLNGKHDNDIYFYIVHTSRLIRKKTR